MASLISMASLDQYNEAASCLQDVCMKGNAKIAKILLDAGADPNYLTTGWDGTRTKNVDSLYCAIRGGHDECVTLLLKYGANPNESLRLVCERGDTKILRMLLKAGGNPNFVAKSLLGWFTPLCLAARHGRIACVKLLLEKGAIPDLDIGEETKYLKNPLCGACEGGHIEIVRILLHHNANIEPISHPGTTSPLLAACKNNHIEIVRVLLENGADVNRTMKIKGKWQREETVNALVFACRNENEEMVRLITQHCN
uniref:Uncharacterized protein n=1 Tax=viral metagenome TaxID=1070528 RepID=A0A6C0I321_9ZZZZ